MPDLDHACHRGGRTCTSCRACDRTRRRVTRTQSTGRVIEATLCAHCDGPAVTHRTWTPQ